MRYLSVCSGIEAASAAWLPLGWTPAAFSEIEPFPCALLKHHYPDVPNLGDMTKFKDWPTRDELSIDLLCGGTPCQSFSVAGLRKGLDDPRGNLMLTYLAIADKYRPEWLVWENVPGVLSSNGGRDFGTFLGGLGQLGYGFAYRILDAQFFGVPQRRRRVFVVGHLGDYRGAAAVLFEQHSLSGHPAPRRETGKELAGTLGARTGRSIGAQDAAGGHLIPQQWPAEIASTLNAHFGDKQGLEDQHINGGASLFVPIYATSGQSNAAFTHDVALACNSTNEQPYIAIPAVTHSLRGEGFDASEDGTGRGVPLVLGFQSKASACNSMNPSEIMPTMDKGKCDGLAVAVALRGRDGGATIELGDDQAFALRASSGGGDKPHVLAFDTTQITSAANRSNPQPGDACHPIAAGAHVPAIAFDSRMRGPEPAVGREERPPQTMIERTGAIDATKPWNVATAMQVRRLTPEECEALQGFPRSYTQVPNRNKPAADGPRYKALGNSWAVPCARWIGERINAVNKITNKEAA